MKAADGSVVLSPGAGRAIPDPDIEIVWKATEEDTGGAYSLQEFTRPPRRPRVRSHVHYGEEEAFYVLEVEMTFTIGDRTVQATAGSFVLIPRGIVHAHRTTGTQPARWLAIVSPPGMGKYFEERAELVKATPSGVEADYAGLEIEVHEALAGKYHMEFK
jgi:quercetin dioxygenase-like cupin family protein